ncbi:hypothetical protein POV27_08890 [Aureisphaera galaxeae]|uniref:hypothetical protein n=1 Tax=Aureisphaera galaxeae TaxID=1538023 RepID=UPI00234FF955|nr:hypothetical protein [Aureisphaera galaxeae]MDC8004164.1 hypothetical protein [Aureisphaera galaxeae]
MKARKTYLRGKSVFIVSLIVVGVTILTVYLTGIHYHRSVTTNFYWSLGIIAFSLFSFLTYGLFKGVGIKDNFPSLQEAKDSVDFIPSVGDNSWVTEIPVPEVENPILSVLVWIGMTILIIILLVFMEFIFWVSIFLLLAMLYWLYFRALRLVFSISRKTIGDFGNSVIYALGYTLLYTGWIFGIVYLAEVLR